MKYKDPTTGDFKELKIRATDELPVGSEIDVDDNTTIPAGWEQTDDVIESGSNANRSYVKYIDGTLICYGVINQTTYPADEWQAHEVSLPQSYKDATYSIQVTIRHDGDGWTNIANFRADSKNNNTFKIMLHNIGSYPVKIGFSWITIGRWK